MGAFRGLGTVVLANGAETEVNDPAGEGPLALGLLVQDASVPCKVS